MKNIELPGVTSNAFRATAIGDHIEVDYDLDDAPHIYNALVTLRHYANKNGLSSITIHPNTRAGYYQELMALISETFEVESYQTVGVFELYRLSW
ncbi:MAG: hypothetical protein LUE22_03670 [Oscillospiraceae bacterium]|nr:hypothetical protein [Oscillospiraceae bacterium]